MRANMIETKSFHSTRAGVIASVLTSTADVSPRTSIALIFDLVANRGVIVVGIAQLNPLGGRVETMNDTITCDGAHRVVFSDLAPGQYRISLMTDTDGETAGAYQAIKLPGSALTLEPRGEADPQRPST